jgi:hypothetical protein
MGTDCREGRTVQGIRRRPYLPQQPTIRNLHPLLRACFARRSRKPEPSVLKFRSPLWVTWPHQFNCLVGVDSQAINLPPNACGNEIAEDSTFLRPEMSHRLLYARHFVSHVVGAASLIQRACTGESGPAGNCPLSRKLARSYFCLRQEPACSSRDRENRGSLLLATASC